MSCAVLRRAMLCYAVQTPLTRESHSSGVSLPEFFRNKELSSFFNTLTLSLDKEGKVSAADAQHQTFCAPNKPGSKSIAGRLCVVALPGSQPEEGLQGGASLSACVSCVWVW